MLISLSYHQQKLPIFQFFANCHRSKRNWEIFLSEDAIIILYNVSYKNHGIKLHFCLDKQNFHQYDTCSISIQYSSENEFWTKFFITRKVHNLFIASVCLSVCPSVCLCVCPSACLSVCPVWNQNLFGCSARRFTSFIYSSKRDVSLPIEPIQSYAATRIISAWYDIANLISSNCFIRTDLVERKNYLTSLHFISSL